MQTITIMPDYGNSPYAWLKDASDTSEYVGENVGAYMEIPAAFPITEELHDRFVSWCGEFERGAGDDGFDWDGFHRTGRSLAEELASQVGEDFQVLYVAPVEDIGRPRQPEVVRPGQGTHARAG